MISNGLKKTLGFTIFFLVVLVTAWLTNYKYHWAIPPVPVTPKLFYTVDFFFSPESKTSLDYYDDSAVAKSLLAITQALATQANWKFTFQDYGQMGMLITGLQDQTNGQDQKYWQYFINGQQPLISADKYYPVTTDKIEWKFEASAF
jgi:hypothetical protein